MSSPKFDNPVSQDLPSTRKFVVSGEGPAYDPNTDPNRKAVLNRDLIRLGGNYVVPYCIPWQVDRPLLDRHLHIHICSRPNDGRDYEVNH